MTIYKVLTVDNEKSFDTAEATVEFVTLHEARVYAISRKEETGRDYRVMSYGTCYHDTANVTAV